MLQKLPNLSWGDKRKLFIISLITTFFIIVFAIAGYVLFNKPASCMDNRQNQNEEGVDCGGVCTAVCKNKARAPVVQWVRIFNGKQGYYSALASFENINDSLAVDVPYVFKLYDEKGALIAERDGKAFIPKIKDSLIYEANIDTKGQVPTRAYFSFTQTPNWQSSSYQEPKLEISKQSVSNDGQFSRLDAVVTNPDIETVKNISFVATLYDDENNAVDASKTYLDSLAKYATAPLVFTWPHTLPVFDRVCSNEVDIAMVLDRSGSMRFLGKNPPQPLTDVKSAADYFVAQLNKKDQVSVISFANTASSPIDMPLTNNFSDVKKVITDLAIGNDGIQSTNIGDGLLKATAELSSSRNREGASKVAILLTDGVADLPAKKGDSKYPETYTLDVATKMKKLGITVFTIGLGKDVNQSFLKSISSTPDNAYFAPKASELKSIYKSIATKICKKGTSRIEITPIIPM